MKGLRIYLDLKRSDPQAGMGLTGNDGVVGIAIFMGGGTMPKRDVV